MIGILPYHIRMLVLTTISNYYYVLELIQIQLPYLLLISGELKTNLLKYMLLAVHTLYRPYHCVMQYFKIASPLALASKAASKKTTMLHYYLLIFFYNK
jgi:hypothetical protein